MKRRVVLSLALLAALCTATAGTINAAYRIHGDGEARPVQVFDDGRTIYVQLRDLRKVPVPIGANGPMQYQLRGYYMMLPVGAAPFTLQLGASRVQVAPEGASEGVVSITRPVEAMDPPAPPAPAVAIEPLDAGGREVTGTIRVAGRAAGSAQRAPSDRVPVSADEDVIASRVRAIEHGTVILRGDGTVAGAEALERARGVCRKLKRACRTEYRGAASGFLVIEEGA